MVEAISVSRNDLLLSQTAVRNLGSVTLPVQKDSYWLGKTLRHVSTALKREMMAAQKESNRLIEAYGEDVLDKDNQKTGKKGISQDNVKVIETYAKDMEAFNAETVSIENTKKIPLSALETAGVSLTIADQSALHWLIQE